MQLHIDSDVVAYLIAPKARSRTNGYHCFGNKDGKLFNLSIFILAKVIIKAVMSSAAESEVDNRYINAREAISHIYHLYT